MIGIDQHFLKLVVAGNRHRLTPSLIYCSANTVLTCNIKLSLKQMAIDRNFQSMPVRAIYYWDCETKSIASDDRYRYTFDQTYCLGRQVSIHLSPNILFREIAIDRPFTIQLVRMIGIGTQTFRHFIVLVLESNGACLLYTSPSPRDQA